MTQPDFVGTERFEIRRTLGAGGMGVVYEALDRERGERVALKTFRTSSPMALMRLKNEFRALQDLHHPNLVGLGELFEAEGRWFFSMELVEGCSFLDHVCPGRMSQPVRALASTLDPLHDTVSVNTTISTTGPRGQSNLPERLPPQYDLDRLRASLRQLAAGLHALHAAQKVHRDVKPSNIIVDRSGRVVLLDFGLIVDVALQTDDYMVGTAAYMAPEQASGRIVGPAADWYSVGVMLYQVLAGRLPFLGRADELIDQKLSREPPPPSELTSQVPEDLERLCVELLRIDPQARPSEADVLRRLDVVAPSDAAGAPLFVGRRRELDALRAAFGEVQPGRAVTVLVHGESGVGKSALVREFAAQLAREARRFVALAGRCYERESVPYKAVDEIVDGLERHLRRLPLDEAARLLPASAPLLAQVFPVLKHLPQIAEAPLPSAGVDPQERRTRLFAGLRELLARLAADAPMLLVIDDLQWADQDSLALLREILAPPDAPALLLVATVRTAGSEEAMARLRLGEVRRVHLSTLAPDDARVLAEQLLRQVGTEAAREDDAMVAEIVGEAGGHPLFMSEVVRSWAAHGSRREARVRLDEALWSRISLLDARMRRVLELLAVAGGPVSQRTIAAEVPVDTTEFKRQVTQLRLEHLVRTGGAGRSDTVETYHDRVRESILAHLDPASLRRLHATLARALEATGGADPEVLANHWSGAGDRDKAAHYTAQAAEQAAAALAFERAARLYRAALLLGGAAPEETQRLTVQLAIALANAGRGREAAEAYLAAVPRAKAAEALDHQRHAAEQLLRSGHFEEGMTLLRRVLDVVGLRMAATPLRALVSLLSHRARVRLRGMRFVERDTSQLAAETLTHIDLCWSVAATLAMVDNIRGADFQARGLLAALDAGEPFRVARALCAEACFVATAGGPVRPRVEHLLGLADVCAQRIDHPYTRGWAALAHGVTAYLIGEWRRTYESCARAEAIFRSECTGAWWEVSTAQLYQIFALFYLGRVGEQSRHVQVSLHQAQERGDLLTATNVRTGLAVHAWLTADDLERARREVGETMERWSREGFLLGHYWNLLAEVHMELYQGHGAAAERLMAERWVSLKRSMLLRIQLIHIEARHMRARCALAAAPGSNGDERKRRLRRAERDARAIAGTRMPWALPIAALLQATVAAIRGARADAIAQLDAAIAGFERCDMALFAAVARRRRGELMGGAEGAARVAAADEWMVAQEIKNPQRTAQLLAPGFDG